MSVGLQSQASDNTAILVDGSGSLVPANWVAFDYRALPPRHGGARIYGGGSLRLPWAALVGDCNGLTQNVVRYDSPTFGGFSVSASWGEDDMWDVAARYAGEFNGFKLAAAAAYNEVSDTMTINVGCRAITTSATLDADYFQAGVYLEHVPTGIFGLVNYGKYDQTSAMSRRATCRTATPGTSRLVCVSVGRRLVTPFSTASTRP